MGKDVINQSRKSEVELGQSYIESITKSDRFYTRSFTPEGRPFFIFSDIGDQIEGYIVGRRSNAHINRTNSYVIKCYQKIQGGTTYQYPNGIQEEFYANHQIQRVFEKNDCIGKYVRIVFVGKIKNSWTVHSTKAYRIFWEKGVVSSAEVELFELSKQKNKKQKKEVRNVKVLPKL